jgi:hypothetical protein
MKPFSRSKTTGIPPSTEFVSMVKARTPEV